MAFKIPVAKMTIDDPRALGNLSKPGWAGDFLFSPPGNQSPWCYSDTEYIPEMHAAAPIGIARRTDMSFGDWQVLTGQWDDKAQPATFPRVTYLHAYDGSVGAVSSVVSKADFYPRWCGWFYVHVPPAGTLSTQACDFSILMRGDFDGPAWRIVIPTRNLANKYPRLTKGGVYQQPMTEQTRCDVDTTESSEAGWREIIVWCEATLNTWIMGFRINGAYTRWVYTPPGQDVAGTTELCGQGPIEVQSQGQQLMFALAPIQYPTMSEVFKRTYFSITAALGDVTDADTPPTPSAVVVKPTGTDCWVDVENDGSNGIIPRVSFVNDKNHRAVCGLVSVYMDGKFDATDHGLETPWTSVGKTWQKGDAVEYTRRSSWRGNSLEFKLYDPTGALTWKGNDVIQLEAAYQTTGDPPVLSTFFTGYITSPERDRTSPVNMPVRITASDFFGARMPHKKMIFMPSFGGMLFGDAIAIIGNRLGFKTANISVDASYATTYLPGSQVLGEPTLAWGPEASPEEALDILCRSVGAYCGITTGGVLFANPLLTYSAPADYTLDSDATDSGDFVRHIRYQRGNEEFANNCYVITGTHGYQTIAWARDSASEDDDTADDFIGDNWQRVDVLERTFANATTLATASLVVSSKFAEVIEWEPVEAQVALQPGKFVKCQIENMQVETDSIWYITEERTTIDPWLPDAGGWHQKFTMVRVQ